IEKYKSTKLCKCKLPKVKAVCNGCGKEIKISKEEKAKLMLPPKSQDQIEEITAGKESTKAKSESIDKK
ncbi:hypothetical protein LCGC14_1629970, partial [marine sediment metagenome]